MPMPLADRVFFSVIGVIIVTGFGLLIYASVFSDDSPSFGDRCKHKGGVVAGSYCIDKRVVINNP